MPFRSIRVLACAALVLSCMACKMPSTIKEELRSEKSRMREAIEHYPCVLTAYSDMSYSVTYRDGDDVEQVMQMSGGYPFFYGFSPSPRQRISVRMQVQGGIMRDMFGNQMNFPNPEVAVWRNGQKVLKDDRSGNPTATSASVFGIW